MTMRVPAQIKVQNHSCHLSVKFCRSAKISYREKLNCEDLFTIKPKASLLSHLGTGLVGSCQCRSSTITLIKIEMTVITITMITYIPTINNSSHSITAVIRVSLH